MGTSGQELDRAARDLDKQVSEASRIPFLGDGRTAHGVNLLHTYAQLIAVSVARAEFLGELLAAQVHAAENGESGPLSGPNGLSGLIGYTGTALAVGQGAHATTEFVATGEQVRALVDLEGRERDRAATLVEKAVKIGMKLDQVEVMRSYAGTISAALKAFASETGLVLTDTDVVNAAKRAALTARRQLGYDDGDPTAAFGRAMGARQRVRVLEAALEAAKREAGEA